MITFYGWVIYASIAAGALVILGGAVWLTARIASDRGYALGALDGYDHGDLDGFRRGYSQAALDRVLAAPDVDQQADALIRDLTGSASFAEALMAAELREGLHEGAAERWLAEPRSPAFWGDGAQGGAA